MRFIQEKKLISRIFCWKMVWGNFRTLLSLLKIVFTTFFSVSFSLFFCRQMIKREKWYFDGIFPQSLKFLFIFRSRIFQKRLSKYNHTKTHTMNPPLSQHWWYWQYSSALALVPIVFYSLLLDIDQHYKTIPTGKINWRLWFWNL